MLLRRITQNVRDQNWLAIGIDFVVVVTGIFIGLQVDGWNEERKDRIRETVLLEQLYVDFTNNGEIVESMVGFHENKVTEIDFAIDVVTRGEIGADDRRRFLYAVLSMYQLPPLGATMGSYDAVIASGDFALIRDLALKSMLIRLSSDIRAEESLLAYFRDMTHDNSARTGPYATVEPNEDRSNAGLQLNFEVVMADPLALSIISSQKRYHQIFQQGRQGLALQFAEIRTHIGSLIGKQAPAANPE